MSRAVYRIIDANFNRGREALRVIEEFCRFFLSSTLLTQRTKQLRHELSETIGQLDVRQLIASRDSEEDIGACATVDNQLRRGDLRDCFTAGCKRLTEALRAIAETAQTLNPEVAQAIEKMRFCAYTLEKDIVLFADAAERFKAVRLYIIITSNSTNEAIPLAHQCIAGGADCIQLRAKSAGRLTADIEDDKLFALACEFVKVCKEAGVPVIINDRVDIAIAAGADGVHLGQDDMPVAQARKLQTTPLIIGKSTHSIEQLRRACEELPAYVSLGPVFATGTKPGVKPVGLDYVKQGVEMLRETGIGHVAIGGITLENIESVLKAGAKAVAVCSAVTGADDPANTCRALKEKITTF